MYKNLTKNNQVYLRSCGDDFYFEKNNVVVDKTCRNCRKLLFEEKEFCECGYFLKAERDTKFWSVFISVWVFIGIACLITLLNIDQLKNIAFKETVKHKPDFHSLTPVNIQVLSTLKYSPYNDYIQNIYVKPKEENKLIILIRPNLWNILTDQEKKDLLKFVEENWIVIYRQNNFNQTKKPEVYFANPE